MGVTMDLIRQILEIAAQGENSAVEFKTGDVRPESPAKEITAFSNGAGGVILLGVADDGTLCGTDPEKNSEEWVMNIARTVVNPPVQPVYNEALINNKKIGMISVPKGRYKPYQTSDGNFYIRAGSTNRIAAVQELMRLFQQSGVFHFDAAPVDSSSVQDLNLTKAAKYFSEYQISFESLSEKCIGFFCLFFRERFRVRYY